ncbi:MAG: diaminopimelate epimerase [Bacteroidales bacterium]
MNFTKAHAYGNDFLFVPRHDVRDRDVVALSRRLCDRNRGIGADGLIVYDLTERGASMRLRNADGSRAEVSGNGVRCLAAILVASQPARAGDALIIETESGEKRLTLEGVERGRYTFRAAMGQPEQVAQRTLDVLDERLLVTTLRVGNPQCVVLGRLDEAHFRRFGPALERHAAFPEGTNVEFAQVEAPDRVRILIWERGVGPTQASGTGACASAVAAAAHGGASRDVQVISPGGAQRVEWRDQGIFLTGWAEITVTGRWVGETADCAD